MRSRLVTGLVGMTLLLVACAGDDQPTAGEATTPVPTLPGVTTAPTTPTKGEPELGSPAEVRARANIFGAGRDRPPDPGGGGGGVTPPVWELPPGSSRIVTFPSVTGEVVAIVGRAEPNGPEGDGGAIGTTDVESFEGISGIIDRRNGMFLVGVFLTDAPPSKKAQPRLDFTDHEDFDLLKPRIGQTFFVGDGEGRQYLVPDDATRLYLGFADAYFYKGAPGYYDNNFGHLEVTVELAGG